MRRHAVAVVTVLALMLMAGAASADIKIVKARIGCLDLQTAGNLTKVAGTACDGKETCSYKAPTPKEYEAAGVKAKTRAFCTQAMEITYACSGGDYHTVMVPGDAWKHPPAELSCAASKAPTPATAKPDTINIRGARIGCLDIQTTPNLTTMVASACNGKAACTFKAPDEAKYKAAGVKAATRTFCTQAMEITYDCGRNDPRTDFVPGDAWRHPPAELTCSAVPAPKTFRAGEEPIKVTAARIGCLDVQKTANLTKLVGNACNGRAFCAYPAPTPEAYRKAGIVVGTRALCSQAMEITYRCGKGDDQVVTVPGDAWKFPPAQLVCNGKTIATNRQDVTPPKERCTKPKASITSSVASPTDYFVAPKDMLDWTKTPEDEVKKIVKHFISHDVGSTFSGFIPPRQPTPDQYPTGQVIDQMVRKKKAYLLGSNEGRLRAELRKVAAKQDPMSALCQAAQRFTSKKPKSKDTPSDEDFGKAFADLSVTGKNTFAKFVKQAPDEAKLKAHKECAGASDEAIGKVLDRAYAVANALRKNHLGSERQTLGWVAVSGEDDQPYRPVNVPSTNTSKDKWFPQFDLTVTVDLPNARFPIRSRYMLAHRTEPAFAAAKPLVDGGKRKVMGDPVPAIADDAEVIVFVHGMDSRVEEAMLLTDALHKLPGRRNWTVLAFDMPTSGYADNIDHNRISPVADVGCHNTPLLDYLEEYIVATVDQIDKDTKGKLKPRIKALVGGSLGGNMAMRLGRRPNTPWLKAVMPWSPAAIWPSKVGQKNAVMAGCDTSWSVEDIAVNTPLYWSGKDKFFAAENELDAFRYMLFYGGFDWKPLFGITGELPQAQCWMSDKWTCKQNTLIAARIDRHETYDKFYRTWHWRLGAEQLAFSHQQFSPGTKTPLYLRNDKPMLLLCGYEDRCGGLCEHARTVASKMINTPGYARWMKHTGHSADTEYPNYVAKELEAFVTDFVK